MFSFVLTGGPKAGKTTILDVLQQEYGSRVVIVPEAATGIMERLFPQPGKHCKWSPEWRDSFQRAILPLQTEMESAWKSVAAAKGADLVVFDRGILDSAGYLDGNLEELQVTFGIDPNEIYAHYDAVLHLETIAVAHPDLYDNSDNPQRYEDTPEKAVATDKALLNAWHGHPNWHFLPSANGIETKISSVLEIINTYVDVEHELKFVLDRLPDIDLGVGVPIAQGYIIAEEDELRIRKIGDEFKIYFKDGGDLSRLEWKRCLMPEVFNGLWKYTQKKRVYKTRYTVPYGEHKLMIDHYHGHLEGMFTMECEFRRPEEATNFVLPAWAIAVDARDVTGDLRYKNKYLASHGIPGEQ